MSKLEKVLREMAEEAEEQISDREEPVEDELPPIDDSPSNKERLMAILEQHGKPLPASTIALILGMDKSHCRRLLNNLRKYGVVRLSTRQTVGFYEATGGAEQ